MKLLFDTNVFLDVFLERRPFFLSSSKVLARAEQGQIEGWICGTTVTTIHYLLSKGLTREQALNHLRNILKVCHVANINRVVLADALDSNFKDFEDAVLYQSAFHADLDGIVTRDPGGFQKGELAVYSPDDLLKAFEALDEEE